MPEEDPTVPAIENIRATLSGETQAGLGAAAVGPNAEMAPLEPGMQRIMQGFGVTAPFGTEEERHDYLQRLTGDSLLASIKIISHEKRGIMPEDNDIGDGQIIVFKNGNTMETADGIRYLPPGQELGRNLLREGLEAAQHCGDPDVAAELLRLIIPLTHVVIDGNGASARAYQKLLSEGHDGSPEMNEQYAELMKSRGQGEAPVVAGVTRESYHNAKYAVYLAEAISRENGFTTPAGTTIVKWQRGNLKKYPFLDKSAGGIGFVEDNFNTAFCLDFIARTGRNVADYTLTVDRSGETYINVEKLLKSARPEENDTAMAILEDHKTRYIRDVIQHYTGRPHPAFQTA